MKKITISLSCLFAMLITSPLAVAHFPWLIVNEEGKLALFFGEGIHERNYKLPESMLRAKVYGGEGTSRQLVELETVQSDKFVGFVGAVPAKSATKFATEITYGIYHGNRLMYYAAHHHGAMPKSRVPNKLSANPKGLQAELIDTDTGVNVFVNWNGAPLADAEVHLYCAEGHEEAVAKTDETGKVAFSDAEVEGGLNALMLGHTVKDDGGRIGDQAYESTMHYCTLTFFDPEDATISHEFDDLPFEITSFGAARVENTVLVYGGHTGDAHSYSTEEQSEKLLSLDLDDPTAEWQVAATGPRLQGLAMVPHGSSVVVIGGFTAKNARGEKQNLQSQSNVRRYDAKSKSWSDLPSLPLGRSSHDASIIGDTIYVVGGWNMNSEQETVWHSTALSLNLADPNPTWTELPTPPFERRALATVAHDGMLYVIGGMDKAGGPTRAVAVYDPGSKKWSDGPELIGEGQMAGFGAAAWSVGGKLIVSTYEGAVLRLSADAKSWIEQGETQDSRFFHRLIPYSASSLIVLGGANMEEGKYLNLELLELSQ